MQFYLLHLAICLLSGQLILGQQDKKESSDGCESGWFRYKNEKCVYIFDVPSSFDEASQYCKSAYGAQVLKITSYNERLFWTFHLLRFSSLSSDVWLDNRDRNANSNLFGIELKNGDCLALRSENSTEPGKTGDVVVKDCEGEAATVCQITVNKQLASKVEPKDFNMNEEYVPNQRLKYSNGTDSDLFSGIYYILTSKFMDTEFSNTIIGNGKCTISRNSQDCANIHVDEELQENYSNYYLFTVDQDGLAQIRRFSSDKLLVYQTEKYLSNFNCFEDGLTDMGRELCTDSMIEYGVESKWRIDQYKNTDYFVIRSNHRNLTLGAIEYKNNGKKGIGFGLYEPVEPNAELNDKHLFKIEELNFTLNVQVFSVEFDGNLQDIAAGNTKQISIVDTAIITNDSPASLVHEVSSTKELTETFSTSYGTSQQFMDSLVNTDEIGSSSTDTKSQSKSFTDTVSESVSQQLSSSMSSSQSSSSGTSSSSSSNMGGNAGVSIPLGSFGSIGGGGSYSSGSSSSSSNTNSRESSQSQSSSRDNSQQKSESKTATDEQSKSATADVRQSKVKTKQESKTIDKRTDEGGSSSKSYTIHKTVNLPAYSSVKISSYANWIDEMTIKFRVGLKFTCKAFRRKMNGEGTNAVRTMDSEFVKYVMRKHKFPGEIVKTGFDIVIGELHGNMKASVGLESVFMAKETKLR